jgi:hypothetical protein
MFNLAQTLNALKPAWVGVQLICCKRHRPECSMIGTFATGTDIESWRFAPRG